MSQTVPCNHLHLPDPVTGHVNNFPTQRNAPTQSSLDSSIPAFLHKPLAHFVPFPGTWRWAFKRPGLGRGWASAPGTWGVIYVTPVLKRAARQLWPPADFPVVQKWAGGGHTHLDPDTERGLSSLIIPQELLKTWYWWVDDFFFLYSFFDNGDTSFLFNSTLQIRHEQQRPNTTVHQMFLRRRKKTKTKRSKHRQRRF